MKKTLLLVSLSFNLLFLGLGSFVVYKKGGINFIQNQIKAVTSDTEYEPYYLQKVSIYKNVQIKNADIAFVGDSITDHGEWNELFPEHTAINRGISNDNAAGVLNRIDEIIKESPQHIFIMIGINDILYKNEQQTVLSDYKKSIEKIQEKLPDSKIYIQSTLPVNNDIYGDAINNKDVQVFNKQLEKIATEYDVNYIDLYSKLSSQNELDKKYTLDGIHLTGEAYTIWKNEIANLVE